MVPNGGGVKLAVLRFSELPWRSWCRYGSVKVAALSGCCLEGFAFSPFEIRGNGELKVFALSIGTTSA